MMESTSVFITTDSFGNTKDGKPVTRYTFSNKNNVTVRIIDYGCIITDILLPDKDGKIDDINLGHDDIQGYEERNRPYFGGVIGRYATRIANGKFNLDGIEYNVSVNNGPNHLHGGFKGFTMVMWDSKIEGEKLVLKYVSADEEEGFPGEVTTIVTYQLTNDNELILDYTATTTKPTPINLSNHAYFNLRNQAAKDISDHVFTINADSYVPYNENWIPTGEIVPVAGTLRDLRKPTRLENRLDTDRGFTLHYCVGEPNKMKYIAKVEHPPTGRSVEVYTTEPGLQCYFSYEQLHNGLKGKGGLIYGRYSSFCLETMNYPDSCNHVVLQRVSHFNVHFSLCIPETEGQIIAQFTVTHYLNLNGTVRAKIVNVHHKRKTRLAQVVNKEKTEEENKKKQDLARHYGFDISMSDSAFGSTTATQRDFKYKCKRIYKDFLKNMNAHIQEEKELRKTLCQLNREKINNKKFSLYRSAGCDLFSTAKQLRANIMKNKLVTVSPLMEEFQGDTPWGLDAIPDEDLIRPQTAPSNSVEHTSKQIPDNLRPITVAKGNSYDIPDEQQQNRDYRIFRQKSADINGEIQISTHSRNEKVRFQSPPPIENQKNEITTQESESDGDEISDGVVDPITERTRARKIVIDPFVFAGLSKGPLDVTLKNKEGKFIIKPVTINYTVSDVDAVFMPKDPSKEKMALVRQKTSSKSATVAADMKINNKIAIMKSLVGKDAKKTTVAEIMENSRYRKTRHFKIVKKLSPEEEKRRESIMQGFAQRWKARTLAKTALPQENFSKDKAIIKPKETALSYYSLRKTQETTQNLGSKGQDTIDHKDGCKDPPYVNNKVLAARERSSIQRPPSQSTECSHDGLNHSHTRITISRQFLESTPGPDRSHTPFSRVISAMSNRDGNQFTGNDKHMTDLIRRLVEGKGEVDQLERPESPFNSVNKSNKPGIKIKIPKRAYTPSTTSDPHSELSPSFDVPSRLKTPEATRRIVKDSMKKDIEYEENMNAWKRRMMSGRSATPFGKRKGSILV